MPEQKYNNVNFLDNVHETVEFSFNDFKSGKHPDGKPWYRYGVKHNSQNASFFADEQLHKLLQYCKVCKGTVAQIAHLQRLADKKQKFWEVTIDGVTMTTDDLMSSHAEEAVTKQLDEIKNRPPVTLRDLCDLYFGIYKKVKAQDFIPAEDRREVTTSLFISATRLSIYALPPKPKEQIDDLPPEYDEESVSI